MESECSRPHYLRTSSIGNSSHSALISTITSNSSAANELFTCFASKLSSSSSMKLTKSFLSPARSGAARDGSIASLSSSLSRRLRPNGSLKAAAQASPFFGKRKGCAFENPEPSSPKVTCIGQVRVKTKKKVRGQQSRSLSKREVSFRKIEPDGGNNQECHLKACGSSGGAHYASQESLSHKNQRWVHLPVSICEALRDFSCLFPCSSSKGSCFGKEKCVDRENAEGGDKNGCGAVFTRWLVSVNDGENGRSRKIELVVGGGDGGDDDDEGQRVLESSARVSMRRSSRRHVFEDIEVKDDVIEVKGRSFEDEEESEARVSICIPPKNALLLMRCRSDPVKMAGLVNRFSWDASACDMEDDEASATVAEKVEENVEMVRSDDGKDEQVIERDVEASREEILGLKDDEAVDCAIAEEIEAIVCDSVEVVGEEEEIESNMSSFEALLDQENAVEHYEDSSSVQEKEEEDTQDEPLIHRPSSSSSIEESDDEEEEDCFTESHSVENPSPVFEEKHQETEDSSSADDKVTTFTYNTEQNPEKISELHRKEEQETSRGLPECLLLMMCEPKLSMEVSKETWVCSTDFLRWLPERPRKPARPSNCCHQQLPDKPSNCPIPPPDPLTDSKEEQKETAFDAKLLAPMVKERVPSKKSKQSLPRKERAIRSSSGEKARSSCTLPMAAAASMAKMIENKLVNAVGYEPFVLTRCKSEPMRTAAAKLVPQNEPCFWKNAVRKMEPPHRRAAPLGVGGAAGVGF